MRFIGLLALAIGILFGGLNGAGAQGSDAAREACTPDAMRLCNEFVPDQAKVRACMLQKRAQLSEPCRLAMSAGATPAKGERRRHQNYHHRRHRYCDGDDD